MTRSRLRIALYLSAVVTASGCRHAPVSPAQGSGAESPAHTQVADDSIFALNLGLVDQDGVRTRLEDLAGRPMVVAMIYTSCTSVCPRVTEDMKAIERQLGPRARDTRFVLFSLDPGRDTAQALRQFATNHHLDLARWRLFATSADGVRDLAAVLDVKYAPAASGEISHSALITVVDAHGVVRHRQAGVGQDAKPLLDALGRAAS